MSFKSKGTEPATPAAASERVAFESDTQIPTTSGNGLFWNKDIDDGVKTSFDLPFEFYGQVTPVTDKKGVTRDMVMYNRLKGGTQICRRWSSYCQRHIRRRRQ